MSTDKRSGFTARGARAQPQGVVVCDPDTGRYVISYSERDRAYFKEAAWLNSLNTMFAYEARVARFGTCRAVRITMNVESA